VTTSPSWRWMNWSEMTGIDEERAKELILKARAHWFE
jgi:hypothetical protein